LLKKGIFIAEHMNNYMKILTDLVNINEVIKDENKTLIVLNSFRMMTVYIAKGGGYNCLHCRCAKNSSVLTKRKTKYGKKKRKEKKIACVRNAHARERDHTNLIIQLASLSPPAPPHPFSVRVLVSN